MNVWRHPSQRLGSELPVQLRRTGVPLAVRTWVSRRCGAAVVDVRRLPAASCTAVHAGRFADGRRLVLRRYVWGQFRREEPHAPTRELAALDLAAGQRLPVPMVVAADLTGQEVGDGVPTILGTRIDGRAHPSPDLRQLASLAASIHRVPAAGFDHHYVPWCRGTSTPRREAAVTRTCGTAPWRSGTPANRTASRGSSTGISTPETCSGNAAS